MARIEVRPIEFPRDINSFVGAWWPIYERDPGWVPPLWRDIRRFLDPQRNPYFESAAVRPFIAYRGGVAVGTIAATWDRLLQQTDPGIGLFGFFEFVDDRRVASALLDAAANWLRDEHGARTLRGPTSFTTNHQFGLRVDPFDGRPPCVAVPHNRSYYPAVYESLGLEAAREWYAYWIEAGPVPEQMEKIEKMLLSGGRVQIRPFNKRRFEEDAELFWQLYSDAWEPNWGHNLMSREEFLFQARQMKPILDPRLVLLAFVDDEFAAGSITLPDYNQVTIHMNGRLLPWGWTHLARRWRYITRLRAMVGGVHRRFQHLPLGVPLYLRTWRAALEMGVEGCEVSLILEDNDKMRGALHKLGGRIHMTHRMYEKSLVDESAP
ncbi:MAG: hypothetical protein AMJ63_13100 [Myxococcales bacterium SG8_38_1]|nr:MAG: hypothetical protein AMJ63_13100 [Myxococcales bacterium SG8_38_1]